MDSGINWQVARRVGRSIVPPGPALARDEAECVVAELKESAAESLEAVSEAVAMPTGDDSRHIVVDRPSLLDANLSTAQLIMADAGGRGAIVAGASLGAVFAVLCTRILGQFDPFAERPALMLCAPNIVDVERKIGVEAHDFRMWVCLHEQTHQVQFSYAPWLRGYLLERVQKLGRASLSLSPMRAFRELRVEGPTSLAVLRCLLDEEMAELLDEVSACMSLIEGHADVAMDLAAAGRVRDVGHLRQEFDARRNRGGFAAVLNKMLGMDAKLAQYADGARFCTRVIARANVETLAHAFDSAETLPSPAEIARPESWLERL